MSTECDGTLLFTQPDQPNLCAHYPNYTGGKPMPLSTTPQPYGRQMFTYEVMPFTSRLKTYQKISPDTAEKPAEDDMATASKPTEVNAKAANLSEIAW